jgi:hypothetical protein
MESRHYKFFAEFLLPFAGNIPFLAHWYPGLLQVPHGISSWPEDTWYLQLIKVSAAENTNISELWKLVEVR